MAQDGRVSMYDDNPMATETLNMTYDMHNETMDEHSHKQMFMS